ncbi:hypothetical protein LPJ57_009936, partial [Coemansia sp. RSA 486]
MQIQAPPEPSTAMPSAAQPTSTPQPQPVSTPISPGTADAAQSANVLTKDKLRQIVMAIQ